MKSQDILLLLKLISLHGDYKDPLKNSEVIDFHSEWRDWGHDEISPDYGQIDYIESRFAVRALANETGISKSQVSLSLKRCNDVGLAKQDRKTLMPKTNTKALIEFIAYGIRYVFPTKPGEITRGIKTSIAAPVLRGQLMTSGDLPPVWPDARGNTKGVAIEPLHKNIRQAVKNDAALYAMLALTDAIRIGQPRERNLALDKLNLLVKELQ
ncbi:MAG: hypothetical protein Q9M92_16290 [Enterobacterales bacterium]|nr:hypothetical protein [Enterobacterales bacterium]